MKTASRFQTSVFPRFAALSLGLVVSTALTSKVSAALLAYEGFDYAVGSVVGQNGGSGFANAWQPNGSGAGSIHDVVTGSLSYTDSLGNQLVTSGNSLHLSGSPTANNTAQPNRDFSFTRTTAGSSTWLSFLIERSGTVTNNVNTPQNPYPRGANVAFFNTGSEQLAVGNSSGALLNEIALIPRGSGANVVPSGNPYSELSFVLVRIDHLGDATVNDNAYMWIDPNLNVEPDIGTADAFSGGFDYVINRVRPFAGGYDTGNGGRPNAVLDIDELRLGETFADVTPFTPVPEPGSLSLIGLGAAALLLKKRRA